MLQRTPTERELAKGGAFLKVEREEQAGIKKAQKSLLGRAQQRAEATDTEAQNKSGVDALAPLVNRGRVVERSTPDPWERLVQVRL